MDGSTLGPSTAWMWRRSGTQTTTWFASILITARGQGSGVEVDLRVHGHFKVRDGKVSYLFEHEDRAAVLKAVGLEE